MPLPLLRLLLLGALLATTDAAQPTTVPSLTDMRDQALADRDRKYDAAERAVKGSGGGPGYHTKTRKGQVVHGTRDSADYAQMLLMRGTAADVERASAILDRLLMLQVTDPASQHYGLWGWYVEEPPQQMAPADWNWADFIGARLAEILRRHGTKLDAALVERTRAALGHAARCIVKRNIGPGYTNICTMGAAVTMAAGGILKDDALLAYGRKRLNAQRTELDRHGGVFEYNSPTYTIVLLHELERVLRLVDDPAARIDAEHMRTRIWELVADQFHPATGQWCGGQSRAYSDALSSSQVLFFMQRTGTGIAIPSAAPLRFSPGCDELDYDPAYRCPPAIATRFARLPKDPHEVQQVWTRNKDGDPAVVLTSWFSGDACLGSVNVDTTWTQRRILTGYWRIDGPAPVVSLRLQLLKDDKDFASGRIWTRQQGNRLLAVMGLAANQGDWHCSLDRPKDGLFHGADLRLRLSITGKGVTAKDLGGGAWSLSAGGWQVAVRTGPAWFDGKAVTWSGGTTGDKAHVDTVLFTGGERGFNVTKLDETLAALAIEMLPATAKPGDAAITDQPAGDQRTFTWAPAGEALTVPRTARK